MTGELLPPLDRIIPVLIEDLRATFGDELVGVYLYGSAISGGFDPRLSDLDLVIVTEPEVDTMDFDRISGVVDRLARREPDWADRLDLAFVGRATLRDLRSGGRLMEISHEKRLRFERAADWRETWFLARNADRAVLGPPPADVFPPITVEEFLADVVEGIPGFIAAVRAKTPDGTVAYRVITLCRVRRSLDSGQLCTKQEGAEWATARYPSWAWFIRAAWDVGSGHGLRRFSDAERAAVRTFLAFMANEIRSSALDRDLNPSS